MTDRQHLVLTFGLLGAALLVTLPFTAAAARGRGVGLHRKAPASSFDPMQLRIGTLIELEHTADPRLSVQIARDHLAEDRFYYTKLCKFVEPKEPKCQPLLVEAA